MLFYYWISSFCFIFWNTWLLNLDERPWSWIVFIVVAFSHTMEIIYQAVAISFCHLYKQSCSQTPKIKNPVLIIVTCDTVYRNLFSGRSFITPWPQSTSETEPPPFVSEVSAKLFADSRCQVVSVTNPYSHILGFLDRSRYYFFQVAPQLYSRGWVDPIPDPLLKLNNKRKETITGLVEIRWNCTYGLFSAWSIARVFRRDSPPTRNRRNERGGGESCSMLTSEEGNAVQGRMFL
jgi:hypothetical protein